MLSLREDLLRVQDEAKLSRREETISEMATDFLRDFIIPKLKNGCNSLSFFYDSDKGFCYYSDSGVAIKQSEIRVSLSVVMKAVKLANGISTEVEAQIKIDKLAGMYYCFMQKNKKQNNSKPVPKTQSFFEDFIKPKLIKIAKLLPDEKDIFCTILIGRDKVTQYVSNIDTAKCFIKNYNFKQIIESIRIARKEGITVDEREIDANTKAIIFSVHL